MNRILWEICEARRHWSCRGERF